jgi:hypothetical protein
MSDRGRRGEATPTEPRAPLLLVGGQPRRTPPQLGDLYTVSQATLHCPLETESEPDQIYILHNLSMLSIAHEERHSAMDVWTGIAERVALTSRSARDVEHVPFPQWDASSHNFNDGLLAPPFQSKDGQGIPR